MSDFITRRRLLLGGAATLGVVAFSTAASAASYATHNLSGYGNVPEILTDNSVNDTIGNRSFGRTLNDSNNRNSYLLSKSIPKDGNRHVYASDKEISFEQIDNRKDSNVYIITVDGREYYAIQNKGTGSNIPKDNLCDMIVFPKKCEGNNQNISPAQANADMKRIDQHLRNVTGNRIQVTGYAEPKKNKNASCSFRQGGDGNNNNSAGKTGPGQVSGGSVSGGTSGFGSPQP